MRDALVRDLVEDLSSEKTRTNAASKIMNSAIDRAGS
jgi:hypothetical protein